MVFSKDDKITKLEKILMMSAVYGIPYNPLSGFSHSESGSQKKLLFKTFFCFVPKKGVTS